VDDPPEEAVAPSDARSNASSGDRRLVAAILRNDRKATAEFVAKYADQIYLYIRSRLIPRTDLVDDMVQEVFLAAWEGLASYRGDSSLASWLQGIARHKVENHYRAGLRALVSIEETSEEPSGAVLEVDLEEFLDRERLHDKARSVLAALPEPYSLALLWRYWERCSAREMAARSGKSEKAIERLLARAREMFRERWKRVDR
jgi:RNA polymerase sigma-70 factor (ECF subfamily)